MQDHLFGSLAKPFNLKATISMMTGKTFAKLPITFVGIALLPGCAFVDQKIDLPYNKPSVSFSATRKPILVARPDDGSLSRKGTSFVILGKVKNGYGMTTADVVSENSVADWVAGALKAELDASGFDATLVDRLPAKVERGLEIYIDDVSVETDIGFFTVGDLSHVKLLVRVWKGSHKIKEFRVQSYGNPRHFASGWASNKARSLETALKECVKKIVTEVTSLN